MTRLVLAMVAATALSGCQHNGQQAIDPFWGRTTVPAPATGSIGAPIIDPGCAQPLQQPVITPGVPVPSGGLQPIAQPNLLPAPMSPGPSTPSMVTPMPATPIPAGTGAPNYGAPTVTAPPSGYGTPGVAPPSGYSSPGLSPLGSPGSPGATMPGSGPAATYPGSPSYPSSPATPGGYVPSTGGTPPMGPSPGSPTPANPTTPAPTGSAPANSSPDYFPPGGYKYDNRSGSTSPSPAGNWVTPGGVAAAPVSLDGATVSAPPGMAAASSPDAGPTIIRIPTGADGGSAATPASAEVPAVPAPR